VTRGYQPGFYSLSEPVRDPESRRRQAVKIAAALQTRTRQPLERAICVDVGCSSGLISASLAPLMRAFIGVEYDEQALAVVSDEQKSHLTFARGDAMRLPFADASVDVVICAQVYEHVPDARQLFAEMARIMKPGAIAFFSGPNWLFPVEPHYFLPFLHWLPSGLADAWLRRLGKGDHYYERSQTLFVLRRMLHQFEIQDVTREVARGILEERGGVSARMITLLPDFFWRLALPFLPNFNWVLFKRA
jgi:2-polyprenyl-3-methyl-5-hydroxy-6-metoxy-1,4-benzoquinol methylase